ncbi:MAG: signal peptide peptidase SppA [Leptospiraceae bacterium]|nr:signal peptide peptidase SppA [Leptospiraceae bacterium]MCK6381772.1 signal peptide peptidase SppA [Leptospiraceae bacterium]
MDKNKAILAVSMILVVISTIIGIINISMNSTKAKYSKSSGKAFLKDAGVGAALIKIEGAIHSGRSSYDSVGSDTVLAKLRDIGGRPEIKGILIEINSPGGTVGASQEIFQELMHLRKTKKIVISMKDVAASGGYYIAAAGDYIFAEHGTLTGSIGVIAMSPNIKGLLEKYGVKMKTYKEGKYKDILSMFRDSTPEEDSIIQKTLADTYRQFVEDVAKGRNKTVSSIEELAQGKIYSGEDAFRNKLVDDLGGRREAAKKLSELCLYDGDIPILEEEESPFDKFFQILGAKLDSSSRAGFEKILLLEKSHSPIFYILPSSIRF